MDMWGKCSAEIFKAAEKKCSGPLTVIQTKVTWKVSVLYNFFFALSWTTEIRAVM